MLFKIPCGGFSQRQLHAPDVSWIYPYGWDIFYSTERRIVYQSLITNQMIWWQEC